MGFWSQSELRLCPSEGGKTIKKKSCFLVLLYCFDRSVYFLLRINVGRLEVVIFGTYFKSNGKSSRKSKERFLELDEANFERLMELNLQKSEIT